MDLPRIDETRETVAERAAVIEADVPVKLDRLRDGEQVLEVGDIERFGDFHHYQGDYPGYKGTCGICSCETVLRMFGRAVTESQLVQHAIEHRLCKRGRTPGEAWRHALQRPGPNTRGFRHRCPRGESWVTGGHRREG